MRMDGWPMDRPNQSSQSVTSSRENDPLLLQIETIAGEGSRCGKTPAA